MPSSPRSGLPAGSATTGLATVGLGFWLTLALTLLAAAWVIAKVDFEPRVASDFFFATDDPQLAASQQIDALFPASPQLFVCTVATDAGSPAYLDDLRRLGDELAALAGVASVQSQVRGPSSPEAAREGPLWRRLVLSSDPRLGYLVLALADDAPRGLIAEVERVVAAHRSPELELHLAGVPWVVEQVRRHLLRDLRVFTLTAFGVFGLLIAAVYRSWRISLATLGACLAAALLTLAVLDLLAVPIGLLTANVITLVFVLTLSHAVFLTARWRRLAGEDHAEPVTQAVRDTFAASFWCMVTTLLGFASLLLASARPLRELGLSGAVGAAAGITVAYLLYPPLLATLPKPGRRWGHLHLPATLERRGLRWPLAVLGLAALAALGLPRLDTDPPLVSYFAPGDEIRTGLERIDRADGTSPLRLVLRAPEGNSWSDPAALARLAKLEAALAADPDVGVALGLPVLLAEARRAPMAMFLADEQLLAVLDSPLFGGVARGFVNADRSRTHLLLRMHEIGRSAPRRQVIARLTGLAAAEGLEVEHVGGLYDLQGRLGALVASSLAAGLGGLFALFLVIAAVVSRSVRTTAAMLLGLAAVPLLLLGTLGWLGQPIDVISSPATNVAIALGIDSMIHLVAAARRQRGSAAAWSRALAETWQPIAGAALILAAGFGIFALSSFPPTQRFGLAVALGTVASAAITLAVFPRLAEWLAAGKKPPEPVT